ncbi:unnamed protein product [Diplocarpon coronariae]|uniref:Uncharacterized protein n=1 Tax=Diplocarpon coronariae TaxID=2795749 RepID=A0A218ZA45_9HELO|nr:hypothetical protein B2J93_4446 [Marssonina coronariae]
MAPARHETGPGQIDSTDDKTPYGTRGSSKRKAAELSTAPAAASSSTSGTKSSTRSTKTKTTPKKAASSNEPRQPPNKKRRSSSSIAPDAPSSPSSGAQLTNGHIYEENHSIGNGCNSSPSPDNAVDPGSSATPGPDADPSSQPIPDIQVNPPSGLSRDVSHSPAPDDAAEFPDDTGISGAGRGRGRGRGGVRGRVYRGRGPRGGRVSKASTNGRGGKPASLSTRGRGSGRGRGGRRKRPEDPVIDVVHKRKAELKAHYKALATFQREALIALAEKSQEMIKNDPKYHETLPEFEQVSRGLEDEYEKCQVELDKRLKQEAGLAKRTLEYQEYIVNQQYRLRIEEIQEEYEGRLMEQANYIYYKKKNNQRDIDEIPFSKGEDGRIVKQSVPPPKRVHGTGHPFMDPGKAVPNAPSTLGDNDYEQHPANWWVGKTKKEKTVILNRQAENVAERERLLRKETGGGRGKKGGRQALFQPNAQQESAEGGDAAAEPEEGAEEQPEEDVAANSPPPTGPASPDEEVETHFSDNLEDSDAQAQETDEFGVSIPRKKGRRDQNQGPFNRIQADAPVHFEPHEIGLRRTHYAKLADGSSKKLGRDIDPNPKNGKFFYEQRQGRYNAGKNQPEDLDQEVVAAHSLHPRLGLPIAKSINPDRDQCSEPYFLPPTDWSRPWENSNPVMFVHTGLDGKRTVSRTSRSEWLYRAKRAFDQIPVADRMGELLEGTCDRERKEATPVTPVTPVTSVTSVTPVASITSVTPESPQVIAEDLIEAAREAAEQEVKDQLRLEEERRLYQSRPTPQPQSLCSTGPSQSPYINSGSVAYSPRSAYHPPPPSFSPPVTMAPPPQRSHGYDPVRDRTYVTPYSQPVRPTPPPQHATFTNGGNLSELANAADFFGTRPPPAAYNAPINPYGAPPMMAQQQQRLSGVYPSSGHPLIGIFSQYQSSPYGPPPPPTSRGGGASARRGARELRPAPPSAENRPQRGQYNSYGGSSNGRST